MQPHLVLLDLHEQDVNEIPLPKKNMTVSSIAFARGKFWMTLREDHFTTLLATLEPGQQTVHVHSPDEGWDPPQVCMLVSPLVLSCHSEPVLYTPFRKLAYWLSDDDSICSSVELPKGAVLGPTDTGALAMWQPRDDTSRLLIMDSPKEMREHELPALPRRTSVSSLCMPDEATCLVWTDADKLLLHSAPEKSWETLPSFDDTGLLWETLVDSIRLLRQRGR